MPEPFPGLDRPPVDGEQVNEHLWPFLGLLAARLPGGWVLIGGQMVLLHGMEHGQLPQRETNDADALVDVRVAPRGTIEFASALTDMGLELEGINTNGIGHRFLGHGLVIDVLAGTTSGSAPRLPPSPQRGPCRCQPEHDFYTRPGAAPWRLPGRCTGFPGPTSPPPSSGRRLPSPLPTRNATMRTSPPRAPR